MTAITSARMWASDYDRSLTASSFGGRRVQVVMNDGSVFLFASALLVTTDEHPDIWFVFSEHYGYHVFAMEDVHRAFWLDLVRPKQLMRRKR